MSRQCADGGNGDLVQFSFTIRWLVVYLGIFTDICNSGEEPVLVDAPSVRGLGLLSTHGFPTVEYGNNMNCEWLIRAAESNQ